LDPVPSNIAGDMMAQHGPERERLSERAQGLSIIGGTCFAGSVPLHSYRTLCSVTAALNVGSYFFGTATMRNKYHDKITITAGTQWGSIPALLACERFGHIGGAPNKLDALNSFGPLVRGIQGRGKRCGPANFHSCHGFGFRVTACINYGFALFP
jgi:hypothetical protein